MQKGVSSTFVLHPEMAVKKGKAYMRLGDTGLAVGEFIKALDYKKDYIPAYMGLVDLNIKLKDYAEADKYLRRGLEYDPDSKGLKRRSIKLGKLMRR